MNHMGLNGANMPNGIGGMAGMQAGANGAAQRPGEEIDFKQRLNTYFYDYLLRNEQYDAARALLNSHLNLSTKPHQKKRPNGMGNDAMDTDSKDGIDMKRPDDLPDPDKLLDVSFENSFLLDWFTLFWEVFMAPRPNRHPKLNPNAVQYMNHTREQSRITNEQRQNLLRQNPMVANNMSQQYRNMMQMGIARNRVNPATMQGLTPVQQQHVMQRQQIMQHQQNMERAGSDVDMNGTQRPRSPNGGMMQPAIDMQNPDFYNSGQMRPGMGGGVNGQGGNHALQDYQMQLMLLEQQNKKRLLMARQEQDQLRPDQQGNMAGQQTFGAGMSPQGSRSGPSPNPSDQMKRGTPKLNQSGLPGSPMPDGNMAGRGSPGAMNFNPNNGNMPMDMMKAMSGNMGNEAMQMGPNGANMRPPSSHPFNPQIPPQQIEAMRAAQVQSGRLNGANYPQGPQGQPPMAPQAGQVSGPVTSGTPQVRNVAMPPPQSVPTTGAGPNNQANQSNANNANANNNNNNANGRTSPAPSNSATTPQTGNKPNPKKAKTKEDRKRTTKAKAQPTTVATPSAGDADPPQTPQPPPTTPLHNKSFNENKAGQAATTAQAVAPTQAHAPVAQPQNDTNMMNQFTDMDSSLEASAGLDMDFAGLEGDEVLNQFDFDQFISNEGQDFDLTAFGYEVDNPEM